MSKMSLRRTAGAAGIAAALLLALAGAWAAGTAPDRSRAAAAALNASMGQTAAQAPVFLTGQVRPAAGATLAVRDDAARREAGGAAYFTAWMFESRHTIHSHGDAKIVQTYSVGSEGAKIKVRGRDKSDANGISTGDDKDAPSPAALLLLHGASGAVIDATVLDPAQTYEFDPTPAFWLGQAANDDSMVRVEAAFAKSADEKLKTSLLFLASLHSGPRGYGFVKAVAMGPEPVKVREQAVFWLGAAQDPRSLADLKAVYAREKVESVKKQIVFGIQLTKSPEATAELIALAKGEPDAEIRKTALFWLGQSGDPSAIRLFEEILLKK